MHKEYQPLQIVLPAVFDKAVRVINAHIAKTCPEATSEEVYTELTAQFSAYALINDSAVSAKLLVIAENVNGLVPFVETEDEAVELFNEIEETLDMANDPVILESGRDDFDYEIYHNAELGLRLISSVAESIGPALKLQIN